MIGNLVLVYKSKLLTFIEVSQSYVLVASSGMMVGSDPATFPVFLESADQETLKMLLNVIQSINSRSVHIGKLSSFPVHPIAYV